jgi:hypothetical protein
MHFFSGVIQKNMPKIIYFFRLLFWLGLRIRLAAGVLCISLSAIYLALFLFAICLHQPINEAQIYFVFLSVDNPKTVLKGGCLGWRGGSSFASLWLERWLVRGCKCAYGSV